MRSFAFAASFIRFRRSLVVGVITFVVVALLYSLVSLDSSFVSYGSAKLPNLPGWLGSASGGTAKLGFQDSVNARQRLGTAINTIFAEYHPPTAALNESFIQRWPTLPPFVLDKKYDYSQVAAASENFFLDDAAYDSFEKQQQALMKAIPTWATVSNAYSGRGVVICAGSHDLERVWPNVVLMLRSLESPLPIQVWTKDQEEFDRTQPLVEQMQNDLKMPISVHTVSDYLTVNWNIVQISEIFKVKALSLLFSSFEEVVLFDSDSVPVMDPIVLFDSDAGRSGLIQWPDYWTNSVSKILHDAYDIDYGMTRTCESGQVMINKKKQFEPLVIATYFNWWGPDFFYRLINLDSMGAGDKDTFWLGSAAYHREYHVVERDLELITAKKTDGSPWKSPENIFNGAMGQFNPSNTNEIFSMHLHAPKINLHADELHDFNLEFFHARKEQNVVFAKGALWLETQLWKNLQWLECDSILKIPTTNVCEDVKKRLISLKGSTPQHR